MKPTDPHPPPEAAPRADEPPLPPRALLTGLLLGAAYGVFARLALTLNLLDTVFTGVSLAFLVVVPFAMGVLTTRGRRAPGLAYRLLAPWVAILITVAVSWAIGWEGAICIVLGLPIMLVAGSVGGVVGAWMRRRSLLVVVPVLPLAVGAVEHRFGPPREERAVRTEIAVAAPVDVVWANVVNVAEIRPDERPWALYTAIGFPAPLSATLPDTGVGAVREARFAGDVLFIETVTAWDPRRHLAFTVRAQTHVIPPSTLDPHVTVGGPYFDVLTGSYRLEPGDGGGVRLVLTSAYRLSTRVNPYAGLWTDLVMRSIQRNILAVIRARAEAAPPPLATSPPRVATRPAPSRPSPDGPALSER